MMLRHSFYFIVFASLTVSSAIAQDTLTDTLARLKSRDWTVRAAAIERVESTPEWLRSSALKQALTELLDHENRGAVDPDSGFGPAGNEVHAEYYSRVLGLVDSLVDPADSKALEVLVMSVYNPTSRFGAKLASYGEPVVAPLLALSQHEEAGREDTRTNAYELLGLVLNGHRLGTNRSPLSNRSARAVEDALHDGLRHVDASVRLAAIHGVLAAGDLDAVPALEQLSRTDQDARTDQNGKRRFLIREEAARAIAEIRTHPVAR